MRRAPRIVSLAVILTALLMSPAVSEARTSKADREEAEQARREAAAAQRLRASSRLMAEVLIQEELARKEQLARREKEAAAARAAAQRQAPGAVADPAAPPIDSGLDRVFGRNERLSAPTASQDRYYMPETIPAPGSTAAGPARSGTPPALDTGDDGAPGQAPAVGAGSAPADGGLPAPGSPPNLELFHSGYSHYSQGDYAAARQAFTTFLGSHPAHELADSAQYWLGQCAAAEGDAARALAEYRQVLESFPFGDKVPDALLKIGEALRELGREEEARRTWQDLARDFPDTGAGRRARERLGENAEVAADAL